MIPAGLDTSVDKSAAGPQPLLLVYVFLSRPEGFTVTPPLPRRLGSAWGYGLRRQDRLGLRPASRAGNPGVRRQAGAPVRQGQPAAEPLATAFGDFIHRENCAEFSPLELLATNKDGTPTGGKFLVFDSPLSEYAVVGFEYGYTVGNPDAVVLWEGPVW